MRVALAVVQGEGVQRQRGDVHQQPFAGGGAGVAVVAAEVEDERVERQPGEGEAAGIAPVEAAEAVQQRGGDEQRPHRTAGGEEDCQPGLKAIDEFDAAEEEERGRGEIVLRLVAALALVQPGSSEHGEGDGGEAGGVAVGEEGGKEARGEGHIDDGDGEDARRRVRFVVRAGAVGVLDKGEEEGADGNQRRRPCVRQGEQRQGDGGGVGGDGAAAQADGFPQRHRFARRPPPAEDVGAAAGGDEEGDAKRALQQGFAVGGEAVAGKEDDQHGGGERQRGLTRDVVAETQAEVIGGAGFHQPHGGRP